MTLSGTWRFCPDPFDDGEKNGWFTADYDDAKWAEGELPNVFDRLSPALTAYEGPVWFRKTVESNALWEWPELTIEAASYRTTAWLNGEPLGENCDPFLPFAFPIGNSLRPGQPNVFVLRVDNTRRPGDVPGPQRGWRPYGGVLRDIQLEGQRAISLKSVAIDATPDGTVVFLATIANQSARPARVVLTAEIHRDVAIPDGAVLYQSLRVSRGNSDEVEIPAHTTMILTLEGQVPEPELWSPESPNRYRAAIGLHIAVPTKSVRESGLDTVDAKAVWFGFRTIEVKDGLLHLNGSPIFLRGFNRHEDSPARDMAADPEQAKADLIEMKRLGANFVRLCHYPHDPATLDLCDEFGLLAMAEIPLYWWGDRNEDHAGTLASAKRQLEKLIARDRNHPSVIFWSVSNETVDGNETVAAGNRELVRLAKSLDPTRLAVHVSDKWRTHPNFDDDDVVCVNGYPSWFPKADGTPSYGWRDELTKLRERWPGKPVLVTEFGYPGLAGVHDGGGSEERQAEAIVAEFADMTRLPNLCGATIWCYADHPWPEDEWIRRITTSPFGIVGRDRTPKVAQETVGKLFGAWGTRPQLHMRRRSLSDLEPLPALPAGYRLRAANADDAGGLAATLQGAFPEMTWTAEDARKWLLDDATVQTVFLIEHEPSKTVVATASARLLPEAYPGAGYVHWVGADPNHRGKRLGWLVSLAVLHEFARLGCTAAVLDTDDFRAPAIKIYRHLAFDPELTHASHPERWVKLAL